MRLVFIFKKKNNSGRSIQREIRKSFCVENSLVWLQKEGNQAKGQGIV